jgi:hypothetical protein
MSEESVANSPEMDAYLISLHEYESAKKILEECLRALHRKGNYPSPATSIRYNLPDERSGVTYRGKLGMGKSSLKFYIRPGLYSDGKVGEIFIDAEKQGSFEGGLLDSFATVFSLALQYGVPLEKIVKKLMFTRFEPSGTTRHEKIGIATSVVDFLVRWLAFRFEPSIMVEYERAIGETHE